ncbi:hypothetical protein JTB14_027008 [Gonioctena quinquepunctata]|nr:hypothetical protein JTB14_027008 [Gonioctena quinquepunctata]
MEVPSGVTGIPIPAVLCIAVACQCQSLTIPVSSEEHNESEVSGHGSSVKDFQVTGSQDFEEFPTSWVRVAVSRQFVMGVCVTTQQEGQSLLLTGLDQ